MKIMITTDGSPCAASAIDHAARALPLEQHDLVVASVAPLPSAFLVSSLGMGDVPPAVSYFELIEQGRRDAAEALETARTALGLAGERATYVQREGEPADQLLAIAEAEHPDLIVMGSHGRGAAGRLFLGSVSEAVLHRWNGAVMIVRQAGPCLPSGKLPGVIGDVMTRELTTCSADLPYGLAAELMAREDVGALPVLASGRPTGIVTDRDLVVRGLAQGLDPRCTTVGQLCSRDLVTVPPELSLAEAARLMERRKVRRLLVLEHERLIGMVALGDLATCAPTRAEEVLVEVSRSPRTAAHLGERPR